MIKGDISIVHQCERLDALQTSRTRSRRKCRIAGEIKYWKIATMLKPQKKKKKEKKILSRRLRKKKKRMTLSSLPATTSTKK